MRQSPEWEIWSIIDRLLRAKITINDARRELRRFKIVEVE